ncbi:uncharacterized protein LOC121009973 [Herpailurus yagouaroundi]|uniref:uncharacterized protein LOC121009973 n=1 Tax=Herpailurus yagouaroundi TaxID=1608482 RepID=UPI001AD78D0B|nr:uncharacterized protein LOC121009973 [Puma yagouaroundi]
MHPPKCTHLGHNREAAAGKQGQGQDPGSAGRASLSFTPAEEEGAREREEARRAGGGEAEVSQPGQSVPEGVFKNLERFDRTRSRDKENTVSYSLPSPGVCGSCDARRGKRGGLHGNVDVRDPGPGTPPPAPARRPGAAPAPICGSWDARGVGAAPLPPDLSRPGHRRRTGSPFLGRMACESDAGGDEPRPPPPPSQTSVCLPPLRSTTEGGGL